MKFNRNSSIGFRVEHVYRRTDAVFRVYALSPFVRGNSSWIDACRNSFHNIKADTCNTHLLKCRERQRQRQTEKAISNLKEPVPTALLPYNSYQRSVRSAQQYRLEHLEGCAAVLRACDMPKSATEVCYLLLRPGGWVGGQGVRCSRVHRLRTFDSKVSRFKCRGI